MMAVPLGIRVACEGLSWGRQVSEFTTAWDLVCRADCPNLGLGMESFHVFAANTPLDAIEDLDPERIFLVPLFDFMWQETPTFEDRMTTARSFRVFPGEGVHSEALADLVLRLDRLGDRGDHSFDVFNDDHQQLPLNVVAQRAQRSARWLAGRERVAPFCAFAKAQRPGLRPVFAPGFAMDMSAWYAGSQWALRLFTFGPWPALTESLRAQWGTRGVVKGLRAGGELRGTRCLP
jgi:hypothetical protein